MARMTGSSLLTLLLACAVCVPAEAAEDTAIWCIDTRLLEAPRAASPALREAIATAPEPDVAAQRADVPADSAAWIDRRASRDDPRGAQALAEAERLGVRVELAELGGVPVRRVRPATIADAFEGALFLHLHGGGYVFGGGDASVFEAVVIAARLGIEVVSVDYRMAPEAPWPAAVEDAHAVWRALLRDRAPGRIAMGGTSAGGGLTLATVQRILAGGAEGPAVLWVGTPWADLSAASDSLHTLEGIDRVLVSYGGTLGAAARLYAGEAGVDHPGPSPVHGEFSGFPPTQLVTGTRDMLLSDAARVHRALRDAGAVADLLVFEGFSHAEYLFTLDAPESAAVYDEMERFLVSHLGS